MPTVFEAVGSHPGQRCLMELREVVRNYLRMHVFDPAHILLGNASRTMASRG
jgi:hypothetical protein